ncbi:alginate lyase family protein [Pedobacter sp. AW1-32]|uniref:alginate lyase family protein n=1 Tax=Pedobacter sp. AW1-32 TaxID=3383026 RepID=UPI003FEED590
MRKNAFIFLLIVSFQIVAAFTFPENHRILVKPRLQKQAENLLKAQILKEADWALQQQPITITAAQSPRSAGGIHDFFSEADYFWPDPKNPDGPYINRDGLTNPDNFVAHRKAMIRFSVIIGALASAYKITGDDVYVVHAIKHLKSWFTDKQTLMNPNLLFAQAVKGRFTGRNYGIIDTIHLMEVAQGVRIMEKSKAFDRETLTGIKTWFDDYIQWLNTSIPGLQEKNVKNNHATCWAMQVAAFAKLCNNEVMLDSLRTRYKTVLLPNQMAADGSFPLEMARTKPFGYSIFNLDAFVMLCQILSVKKDNLWAFETADGKSIRKGISYLYPYIENKLKWSLKPDVMYWENWPVAQPFLLFGAIQYEQNDWFATWKKLEHNPEVEEVIRNLPIRHPLIWL